MTSERRVILSASVDPLLLRTRQLVLEHAGFDVLSCPPDQALSLLHGNPGKIYAVVLGHSIGLDSRIGMAFLIREIEPNVGIVMIHMPWDFFDASACDAIVEAPADPEKLIRAVRRAVKKHAK